MQPGRRTGMAVIVACLGVGGLLLPASAHEYDGTTVTVFSYDSADDRWRGRVGSFEKACERRRKIRLQERDGGAWKTVATTRSRRSGRWRIAMVDADGSFRVVVRPRTKVTIEHEHLCDRFVSRPQDVGAK